MESNILTDIFVFLEITLLFLKHVFSLIIFFYDFYIIKIEWLHINVENNILLYSVKVLIKRN